MVPIVVEESRRREGLAVAVAEIGSSRCHTAEDVEARRQACLLLPVVEGIHSNLFVVDTRIAIVDLEVLLVVDLATYR